MKLLRLLPLLLLPALLLGDTCVTRVDQKGPDGPWVGEVINTGPDPVAYALAQARIIDVNGIELTYTAVGVCPPVLFPGEKGAFEFPADSSESLPLRAEVEPILQTEPGTSNNSDEGLTARVIQKDTARRFAIIEILNQSAGTYDGVSVCANLRTPDGKIAATASAGLFPTILNPGEKGRVSLFFSSMPDGALDLYPSGYLECCSDNVTFNPSLFHVTAKKIVDGPQGRELRVVGEMKNTSGNDLDGGTVQAYLEGEPAFPVMTPLGCAMGTIERDTAAPATFTFPLQDRSSETSIVVQGISAYESTAVHPLPASNVTMTPSDGLAPVRGDFLVSATLSNPTSNWLIVRGACFNLRTAGGTFVGTSDQPSGEYIAPGGTLTVSGTVSPLAVARRAEVIAYADVALGPPPTPLPLLGPVP